MVFLRVFSILSPSGLSLVEIYFPPVVPAMYFSRARFDVIPLNSSPGGSTMKDASDVSESENRHRRPRDGL
ncbi:MAG: hypothetical protein HC767_12085 [Akkermansiaceae bacterium]|nr:hypothetical protein [Akkermansiaceae bacterium]